MHVWIVSVCLLWFKFSRANECTQLPSILQSDKELAINETKGHTDSGNDIIQIHLKNVNATWNTSYDLDHAANYYGLFVYFLVTEKGKSLLSLPAVSLSRNSINILSHKRKLVHIPVFLGTSAGVCTISYGNLREHLKTEVLSITEDQDKFAGLSTCYYELHEDWSSPTEILGYFLPTFTWNEFKTICKDQSGYSELDQSTIAYLVYLLILLFLVSFPSFSYILPEVRHQDLDFYEKNETPYSVKRGFMKIFYGYFILKLTARFHINKRSHVTFAIFLWLAFLYLFTTIMCPLTIVSITDSLFVYSSVQEKRFIDYLKKPIILNNSSLSTGSVVGICIAVFIGFVVGTTFAGYFYLLKAVKQTVPLRILKLDLDHPIRVLSSEINIDDVMESEQKGDHEADETCILVKYAKKIWHTITKLGSSFKSFPDAYVHSLETCCSVKVLRRLMYYSFIWQHTDAAAGKMLAVITFFILGPLVFICNIISNSLHLIPMFIYFNLAAMSLYKYLYKLTYSETRKPVFKVLHFCFNILVVFPFAFLVVLLLHILFLAVLYPGYIYNMYAIAFFIEFIFFTFFVGIPFYPEYVLPYILVVSTFIRYVYDLYLDLQSGLNLILNCIFEYDENNHLQTDEKKKESKPLVEASRFMKVYFHVKKPLMTTFWLKLCLLSYFYICTAVFFLRGNGSNDDFTNIMSSLFIVFIPWVVFSKIDLGETRTNVIKEKIYQYLRENPQVEPLKSPNGINGWV